jgi:putative DNA methylase
VLKPGAPLVCVYAHKTVAGWATLIEALRSARFVVTEAWPLDTEKPGRLRDQNSAALASSIFLVARRREGQTVGSYEREIRPELEAIVHERTETLWAEGVTGADLVIAAVGAGLRAFTRFERVELENGEELAADRFVREVEGAVLETVLHKVGVRDADPATKFYLAWRLQYRSSELDAGEAIVFAYPLGVELDGANGLTAGARALVVKKGKKMRLRDYSERGEHDKLGLPDAQAGTPAPLIDLLHRTLWLMEQRPARLREFLEQARPDGERLRLVAQALAGTALQGTGEDLTSSPGPEQSAVRKLIANWRSVFEESLFSARPA